MPTPNWKRGMKKKMPLPPQHKLTSLSLAPPANANPSSPPQHESSSLILPPPANQKINLTLDEAVEYELKHGRKMDPNVDKQKFRRTISNKLSAERSRMKRSQYIYDMQKMVKDLEDKISFLTPQIESCKEKQKQLLLLNNSLQKLVEIRSNESRISDMLLEQKRLEICCLKELAQTVNNNSRNPVSGQEEMQDSRFNGSTSQPYSLEIYQNGLRKLGSKQFSQKRQQPLDLNSLVIDDEQRGFTIELPVEGLIGEESPERKKKKKK